MRGRGSGEHSSKHSLVCYPHGSWPAPRGGPPLPFASAGAQTLVRVGRSSGSPVSQATEPRATGQGQVLLAATVGPLQLSLGLLGQEQGQWDEAGGTHWPKSGRTRRVLQAPLTLCVQDAMGWDYRRGICAFLREEQNPLSTPGTDSESGDAEGPETGSFSPSCAEVPYKTSCPVCSSCK